MISLLLKFQEYMLVKNAAKLSIISGGRLNKSEKSYELFVIICKQKKYINCETALMGITQKPFQMFIGLPWISLYKDCRTTCSVTPCAVARS